MKELESKCGKNELIICILYISFQCVLFDRVPLRNQTEKGIAKPPYLW